MFFGHTIENGVGTCEHHILVESWGMQVLFTVVLPVFLVSGLVALLQPRLRLNGDALARTSMLVFVPAMTLQALLRAEGSLAEMARVALAVFLEVVVLLTLTTLVARWLRLDRAARGALACSVVLVNAGAFALPVLLFAYGEVARLPGMFHVVLFNVLLIPLTSLYLAVTQQPEGARLAALGGALRRVARTPVIYAALLGLLLRLSGLILPKALLEALDLIANGAVPLLMVLLGVQLAETFSHGWQRRQAPALTALVVLRLIIAPLLALALAELLGLEGITRAALVINGGMSTAILASVLARDYGADVPLATLGVLVTTVLGIVTTTLWLNWLL